MAISLGGFSGGGGGASTDTLDDVTSRGATTTNALTVGGVSIGTQYSLPTVDGSANQVLQSDGNGNISFQTLDFTGGLEYKGSFNATTGQTSSGTNLNNAEKGDFYVIDTVGTIYGQTWAVGDHLLINEDMGGSISNSKIDKIDNTDQVTSVNGNTGAVTLSGDDLTADHSASHYTPANTNIDGHLSGIDSKFGTLATVATSGAYSDLSGTPTLATVATSGAYSDLSGTPSLATVATTGAYSDLSGLPTLGTASASATTDFLASNAELNDLSDVSYTAGAGIDNYVLTYDHSTTSWGAEVVPSAPVTSVNGNTGAVTLSGDDLTADHSASHYTPANSNVDGHLSGIDSKFGTLATVATSGAYSDLSGTPALATVATTGAYSDLSGTPALATVATTGAYSDLSGTPSIGYPVQTAIGGTGQNAVEASLNSALLLTATSGTDVEVELPLISTASDGDVVIIVRKNAGSLKISQNSSESVADPIAYFESGTDTSFTITNNQQQIHVRFDSAGAGRWYIYDKAQGTAALSNTTDFLSATGADSLGGNIDVNGHEIVSSSNNNVTLRPDGVGIIKLGGNTNPAELRFYCETTDQHYVGLKAPTHSELAGKSSISWRLPIEDASTSGDALVSDGNGNLSFTTISGGGASAPTVTSASPGSNYTISTHADNEEIYLLNPSTNISVLLPSASSCGSGYKYQIKNLSANTLTIDPNGSEYIDHSSQTTFAIDEQYTNITLVTDGSNWFII